MRARMQTRYARTAAVADQLAPGREVDPIALFHGRADALAQRAVELKKLVDAWEPLLSEPRPRPEGGDALGRARYARVKCRCGYATLENQLDPLGKVAEYQRAIEIIADPKRRAAFDRLRSMWIALGNELSSFDELQLSTIAQIHTQLMSAYANAMH